jgi:alpha-D-xyloside xylohydrolase
MSFFNKSRIGRSYFSHIIILLLINLIPCLSSAQIIKDFKQVKEGLNIELSDGLLKIYPLTENSVRVQLLKDAKMNVPELIFSSKIPTPQFKVTNSSLNVDLKTKEITVSIDKQTGVLSYKDISGKVFLIEKSGSRKLTPDSVMGEPCFVTEQSFESPDDEYIFGLGQFQDGHYNLRNVTRRLTQVNSQISIPFIYSSKGYGLLWHQYGLTDFNPADNFVPLEKHSALSGDNKLAEVTTMLGTQKVLQNQSLYTGKFNVPVDGTYSFFLDLSDMDNRQYLVIDGKPVIDISNFWLPPTISTQVELIAGEHQLQLICKSSNNPKVSWKLIDGLTTFRSPDARQLDYVVFYGSADDVISTYRSLSGNAPMFPLWAFGFWQCRERYTSAAHLIETVKEFRKRSLPMDVIVQDWQYWGNNGWGVPKFDEINYPNPSGFIKELHELNAHFNISIWSNPDKKSAVCKEYVEKNLYIPNTVWLDYFNPVTRKTYWKTLNENLFSHGVDSWWMDATEPENDALKGKQTFFGLGNFYRLTYPMFVSQAVYEGQRKISSDKRVCILTRSAFSGQQRYGIINWSGDIGGTWDSYKRQIVAGLNYCISGLPYWTTDIGGFFRPGNSQYTDEKFQELLIRWFQWGVFNPIFRIHGYQTETEPWKYGQNVEENIRKMLNLRYRLLPYIYSEAWQITKNGSTLMRPLVMDFKDDTTALDQPYEYMFGKSFLIAPVIKPKAEIRELYLPKGTDWYDFWTSEKTNGGLTINKAVPIDIIPVYVKAGSIIPVGPDVQYAGEKRWDNLEVRIYPGADGEFTLYEDENDNYNYEKGKYSIITFQWEDAKKTLTINNRKGSFLGMLNERKFNIVIISENDGIGMEKVKKYDKVVTYYGKKVVVKL